MLIRRQTTSILQILCEISLHSQVIFKSMKVADDISRGILECERVNPFMPVKPKSPDNCGDISLAKTI